MCVCVCVCRKYVRNTNSDNKSGCKDANDGR